jgi:hypothetical protein
MRNAYRILVGKPEGMRLLERTRRRWEDSIKMDIKEIGCESVDWIQCAQDRFEWWAVVNTTMKLRASQRRRIS